MEVVILIAPKATKGTGKLPRIVKTRVAIAVTKVVFGFQDYSVGRWVL